MSGSHSADSTALELTDVELLQTWGSDGRLAVGDPLGVPLLVGRICAFLVGLVTAVTGLTLLYGPWAIVGGGLALMVAAYFLDLENGNDETDASDPESSEVNGTGSDADDLDGG